MDKYMHELGYGRVDFAVACLQAMYGHVYYFWNVLKAELGHKQALETYGAVWESVNSTLFRQAAEELGIDKVTDVSSMGRIIAHNFSSQSTLYETVENTPDRHVGRVLWCANPVYGPNDCLFRRHEYYRDAEVPLTVYSLEVMVKEAKKMGLKDDIEIAVPEARCRDGNASFCQIHLWRKGSPQVVPEVLPDTEKAFIEDEMSGEEPIVHILHKQGKKLEDYSPACLRGFIYIDMVAWEGLEGNIGEKKSLDIYKKLWLTYPSMWVKDAKLELEIGKVSDLVELARIIKYCQRKRFVPYQVLQEHPDYIVLVAKNDPFFEIPSLMGKKPGDSYFHAVDSADQVCIEQVITDVKMSDKAKVSIKNRLTRCDDRNEIRIERR